MISLAYPNVVPATPAGIRFDAVRKTFARSKAAVVAVDDISFEVVPGEVVGLLGPNGAGKTTLLRMLGRLVVPDAGHVQLGGMDVTARRQPLKELGIVLEGGQDIHDRLMPNENIEYFGRLMGVDARTCRERGAKLLERFGLQRKTSVQARHLSRGMRHALSLCVALIHEPRFLVLDEPTVALDPGAIAALSGLIVELRYHGLGMLIASHDLSFVQGVADRILIIGAGRILKEIAAPRVSPVPGPQEFQIKLARLPARSELPPHLRSSRVIPTAAGVEIVCAPAELGRILDALSPFGLLHVRSVERTLVDEYLAAQARSSAKGRVAA